MTNQYKVLKIIFIIEMIILGLFVSSEIIKGDSSEAPFSEPFVAEVTAYTNPNGNKTYSGKDTVDGITIAGKKEWIGCVAAIYYIDDDGSIGDFFGYREVTDTGYGHASTLYPGQGTIETGETLDIFMTSYDDAIKFGSKKMYIQIIPGKG